MVLVCVFALRTGVCTAKMGQSAGLCCNVALKPQYWTYGVCMFVAPSVVEMRYCVFVAYAKCHVKCHLVTLGRISKANTIKIT